MRRALIPTAILLLLSVPARAQLDPERRLLLEGGAEDGIGAPGPLSPYAFLYFNRPSRSGSVLRLAVAPAYADAELGLRDALGPGLDAGFGFNGGGYSFGNAEVRRGDEMTGESFIGHGGGPSLSLYPRLGALGPAPLNGVLRVAAVFTDYQRTARTDAGYDPPPDEWTGIARAGLRLGGVEPGLDRGRALEVSGWWETRLRDKPAAYGYAGDRFVRRAAQLYWARLHASLPGPAGTRVGAGFNAGGGAGLGRLSAYRLGGMLAQTAEFPLILPGCFGQEVFARRFLHAWGSAGIPALGSKRFLLRLTAAGATVTPVHGTDAGGIHHAGLSPSLVLAPPDGSLRAELSYGWSPTALRGGRRGAHSVALSVEYDLLGPAGAEGGRGTTRQQGLRWLFGR